MLWPNLGGANPNFEKILEDYRSCLSIPIADTFIKLGTLIEFSMYFILVLISSLRLWCVGVWHIENPENF